MKERLYYPVTQHPQGRMAMMLKTALDPDARGQLREGAVDRSRTADCRRPDDGSVVSRSLEPGARRWCCMALFGGGGPRAVGHRHLRRAGIRCRAACREFGIRQALGADRRAICRSCSRRGSVPPGGSRPGLGGALVVLAVTAERCSSASAATIVRVRDGDNRAPGRCGGRLLRPGVAGDPHRADVRAPGVVVQLSAVAFSSELACPAHLPYVRWRALSHDMPFLHIQILLFVLFAAPGPGCPFET